MMLNKRVYNDAQRYKDERNATPLKFHNVSAAGFKKIIILLKQQT